MPAAEHSNVRQCENISHTDRRTLDAGAAQTSTYTDDITSISNESERMLTEPRAATARILGILD